VAGGVTWIVARRTRRDPAWDRLTEATARRYLACSHFDWEFVRAKLRRDPLYRSVFARLESIASGSVVDLGCGRGIALALLATAEAARVPVGDPGPGMIGVEARTAAAATARTALGARARIEIADLSTYEPPPADAVLLLDVLHYLDDAVQRRLIALVARQLRPGGFVLVRETDAAAGARFHVSRSAERLAAMARGGWRQRFHYRPAAEWAALFESHGLRVSVHPMSRGTPFSNVLLEARTPPA
jgi:SAM-dependent methyltransferase